ncbi:MAG: hypothetical protein IKS01_01755 [Paludibacteraceae bacterium]|nr:hypothetical protein [Paludibacteraceae bacterium]
MKKKQYLCSRFPLTTGMDNNELHILLEFAQSSIRQKRGQATDLLASAELEEVLTKVIVQQREQLDALSQTVENQGTEIKELREHQQPKVLNNITVAGDMVQGKKIVKINMLDKIKLLWKEKLHTIFK